MESLLRPQKEQVNSTVTQKYDLTSFYLTPPQEQLYNLEIFIATTL